MQQRSYWSDTAPAPSEADSAPLPARADVAVLGGGITGLTAALALARRGASVVVLEANSIGWGASSRNGGMVLTGLKIDAATLIARYGLDAARELFKASVDSVNSVDQLVRSESIDCQFARRGHLALASKAGHYADFERSAELLAHKFNHPTRLVPRPALNAEIGSTRYFGGLIDEASGGINPAQYVAGLARTARSVGATLRSDARVERMERQGASWRLSTVRGIVAANEVLVATSGYTGAATPELRRRVLPIGSYVIATDPLPDALAQELSPTHRMMYDSMHFLHYFRLTADNRLLIGGRARFVPENDETVRASADVLRAGMLSIYPQLRDARVAYAWGGTLDFAFDTMPHVGRVDGYYFALGYAGHGVALATHLGLAVGNAIGTDTLETNPFARLPFRGAPRSLRSAKDGVLPLIAAWYRFLDFFG